MTGKMVKNALKTCLIEKYILYLHPINTNSTLI